MGRINQVSNVDRHAINHVIKQVQGMSFDEFLNWFMENIYFSNYRLKQAMIQAYGDDLNKMYKVLTGDKNKED